MAWGKHARIHGKQGLARMGKSPWRAAWDKKHGDISTTNNLCITQGNDGVVEWYGAEAVSNPPAVWSYGSMSPEYTIDGQFIFAIKWRADGTFQARIGDAGINPVTDTNIIVLKFTSTSSVALTWNESTFLYEGVNQDLAANLITNYVPDKVTCITALIIPDLFISYNFDLKRGTA